MKYLKDCPDKLINNKKFKIGFDSYFERKIHMSLIFKLYKSWSCSNTVFFQYKQHNYTEDYKQEELTLPLLLEIDLSKVSA